MECIVNNQKLKSKLKKIADEKNIEYNIVLRFYMYDRFIERLSKSKYKDNFVLKGGFYLSTIFGLDNRSTQDMDTMLRGVTLNRENLLKIINEIAKIDLDDDIVFKVQDCVDIMANNKYCGLSVNIEFNIDKIRDYFSIDVATGEITAEGPISYRYKSLIDEETYDLWAYSLEGVLAEKIETSLSKLDANSRMKDYYDLYLLYKLKYADMDKKKLKHAINDTLMNRKFNNNISKSIEIIRNSDRLKLYWKAYTRKHAYAKDVKFDDCVTSMEKMIKETVGVEV